MGRFEGNRLFCYTPTMTRTMKRLLQRIETLPDDDQDALALVMLEDIDKIEALRAEIDPAIEQLDNGQGNEFKSGMFINALRQKHGIS